MTVYLDCSATDIILARDQANALLAGRGKGAMDHGRSICAAFADAVGSTLKEPRSVTVLKAQGPAITGQIGTIRRRGR